MDIGEAIHHMREGRRVCRTGWNGKNMFVALQTPDENSKMTLAYVYMKTADNQLVPWLASQSDVLADDWQVYGMTPDGLGIDEPAPAAA